MLLIKNIVHGLFFYLSSRKASTSDFPYTPRGILLNKIFTLPGYENPFLSLKVLGNSKNIKNSLYINSFIETLELRKAKKQEVIDKYSQVAVVPRKINFSTKSHFAISFENLKDKKVLKIPIRADKFNWLNNSSNNRLKLDISKQSDLYISKYPINLRHKQPHLFLMIFVDGLAMEVLKASQLDKNMPNTEDFFASGVVFKNNYATSDWSLPSLASIFTGQKTIDHLLWHPSKSSALNPKSPYLPRRLREHGFNNFQISSNWRQSPFYGYAKDFHRSLYLRNASDEDAFKKFFENDEKLRHTKRFFFLTLFSLHRNNEAQLDFFNNSFELSTNNPILVKKSINLGFDMFLKEKYISAINYLDNQLNSLYEYVIKISKSSEVTVMIVSDHGQSFLDKTNNRDSLTETRVKVPIFIYSNRMKKSDYNNITSNADIMPLALSLVDKSLESVELVHKINRNLPIREIARVESIYPNKPYELMLITNKSKYHFKSLENVSEQGHIPVDLIDKFNHSDLDTIEKKLIKKEIELIKTELNDHNAKIKN